IPERSRRQNPTVWLVRIATVGMLLFAVVLAARKWRTPPGQDELVRYAELTVPAYLDEVAQAEARLDRLVSASSPIPPSARVAREPGRDMGRALGGRSLVAGAPRGRGRVRTREGGRPPGCRNDTLVPCGHDCPVPHRERPCRDPRRDRQRGAARRGGWRGG